MPMLMMMLMMLALTPMLMLDAYDAATYAAANDANADAKMPNDARHLVGSYAPMCLCAYVPCVAATTVVADADATQADVVS